MFVYNIHTYICVCACVCMYTVRFMYKPGVNLTRKKRCTEINK